MLTLLFFFILIPREGKRIDREHIIDETATIPGADIEKVYDDCF